MFCFYKWRHPIHICISVFKTEPRDYAGGRQFKQEYKPSFGAGSKFSRVPSVVYLESHCMSLLYKEVSPRLVTLSEVFQ